MRRFFMLLAALLLLITAATGVSAATSVTAAQAVATVNADGSCQVNLTVTVHTDAPVEDAFFPVPREATAVRLNGYRVLAPRDGQIRKVSLSRVMGKVAGNPTFSVQYTLRDVIHTTETDTQQLQLPLLSGFAYTIESLQFTVTLPGTIDAKPAFTSGYHQSSIEADLSCTVEGMTVTGASLKGLKDHETLTLLLDVSDEMFPRTIVETRDPTVALIAMGICAGLALLFWLITMRDLPLLPHTTNTPPEGFSAGTLGCVAGMQGADLSLLVLTWAELGYLQLQRDRRGNVSLIKRMDMGNERSDFEQRCFKKIFERSMVVDTASAAYARLHRSLAGRTAQLQELIRTRPVCFRIFRLLACGIGIAGGVGMGLVWGSGAALMAILVFVLGVTGGLSGWYILAWADSLLLHRKPNFIPALLLCGLWLLIGLMSGAFYIAGYMVAGLLLAGLLLRIGGLRTHQGKQITARIRGLRYYLIFTGSAKLRRRLETDPEYFFRMLPYAMALGVDTIFARRFGSARVGSCPYLTGSGREGMTASQWCSLLRKTVSAMEQRANQLPYENLVRVIHSLIKR